MLRVKKELYIQQQNFKNIFLGIMDYGSEKKDQKGNVFVLMKFKINLLSIFQAGPFKNKKKPNGHFLPNCHGCITSSVTLTRAC